MTGFISAYDTGPSQNTGSGSTSTDNYRPAYLDHFERKEREQNGNKPASATTTLATDTTPHLAAPSIQSSSQNQRPQPTAQLQPQAPPVHGAVAGGMLPFQRSFVDGDFDFVSTILLLVLFVSVWLMWFQKLLTESLYLQLIYLWKLQEPGHNIWPT